MTDLCDRPRPKSDRCRVCGIRTSDDLCQCPAVLLARIAQLTEIRDHGCDCGDDDACSFVRDRDTARAEVDYWKRRAIAAEIDAENAIRGQS